jgi:hypothetical protein
MALDNVAIRALKNSQNIKVTILKSNIEINATKPRELGNCNLCKKIKGIRLFPKEIAFHVVKDLSDMYFRSSNIRATPKKETAIRITRLFQLEKRMRGTSMAGNGNSFKIARMEITKPEVKRRFLRTNSAAIESPAKIRMSTLPLSTRRRIGGEKANTIKAIKDKCVISRLPEILSLQSQ